MHSGPPPSLTPGQLRKTNLRFFNRIPLIINEKNLLLILKKIPSNWKKWYPEEIRKLYLGLTISEDKGCWITKDWSVYRQFRLNNKNLRAHRFSYLIFNKPINPKLFICHHCDRPGCVNPYHLFAGTQSDNMKDARNKHRVFDLRIKSSISKELREKDRWRKLKRFCQ